MRVFYLAIFWWWRVFAFFFISYACLFSFLHERYLLGWMCVCVCTLFFLFDGVYTCLRCFIRLFQVFFELVEFSVTSFSHSKFVWIHDCTNRTPRKKQEPASRQIYIYRNTHIRIRIYCNFLQSIYSFRIYYLVRHFVPFKMDFAFSFNFMIGYFSFRKTFHFNVVDFYLFLSFYLCMCV